MKQAGHFCAVGLVAAFTFSIPARPAHAELIDLSTKRCGQFINEDKKEIEVILTWMDAYYKEDDDPPVIDTDKMLENAKKLSKYCNEHPTIGLITAADKLFSKK